MPRHARLDAPGTLHHVMGRGITGSKIFKSNRDREDFLGRMARLCEAGALAVYAWALMDTHFHLLVRTGNESVSSNMRKLLTGYVVNFNRRHRRYGHLFQNRYKSIICEEDPYLLELTRYIHLNPVRAGIVKDMDRLDAHPWTGHAVIMGRQVRLWQDRNTILGYFAKTEGTAKARYHRFVEKGLRMGRRGDLTGGGLLRSAGGRSEVASLRQRSERIPSDERILGSGAFVSNVLHEAEQGMKEDLVRRTKIPSLARLAALVSKQEGIEISVLLSGSRKRLVARARHIVCQIAVNKLRYTGASVARYLGVTTSLVNRMAGEDEIAGLERYYKSSL